jgi:hypothetical protein
MMGLSTNNKLKGIVDGTSRCPVWGNFLEILRKQKQTHENAQ